MASYDTCYYMLSHHIIYIYAIVLSYRIILLLLLLYLYIYKQLHGNDDMNLCKSTLSMILLLTLIVLF